MKLLSPSQIPPLVMLVLLGSASLSVAAEITQESAQESVQEMAEVIVTAELRESTLQKVAKSVTVIDESQFKLRGASHLEEMLNVIPNLNFASGTSRARFFQIRGIGERSQFVEPVNPSVGVLIDDIDFTGAGSMATLFDVEQIEVLKGPQSTRYGANALAGLINIKTKAPTAALESSLHLSSGQYNTQSLGATLSGPLSNSVSFRIAAQNNSSDGYINNAWLGRRDTNNRDEQTIRSKLHWKVRDNYMIKINLFKIDFDNGYDAFSLDNTRTTLSDDPGHDRQDSLGFSINNHWQLSSIDLDFIVGASDSDLEYAYDEDWSYTGIHPWGYTSKDSYERERKTLNYELRLVSNENSMLFNDTTSWVAGIYKLQSDEKLLREYTYLANNYTSSHDYDTTSIYMQLDTQLSSALELSTAIRLESRRADYITSDDIIQDLDSTHTGGRLTLKHQSANTMRYITLAKGYKAGGFNTDGTLDANLRSFNAETMTELEVGMKSLFLDGRLATRLAVFYDDRNDQQVKSSFVRLRPDGSTEFVDFLDNAAEGTNKGIEAELEWRPSDNIEVVANIGLLSAKFDRYLNEANEDLSGRDQAHAPGNMFSLGLNYYRQNLSFHLSMDGKDSFYLSDRHQVQTESFVLLNANISYQWTDMSISIWGRNLANEDYYVRGFGSFGNDPRKFYVTEPYFQFGEPKMLGVDFSWNFL